MQLYHLVAVPSLRLTPLRQSNKIRFQTLESDAPSFVLHPPAAVRGHCNPPPLHLCARADPARVVCRKSNLAQKRRRFAKAAAF